MTKRQKIWDVLFPFAAILIYMAAASVIVLFLLGLMTGLFEPEEIYQSVKSAPLLVSCCFYGMTLFFQYRTFRTDELRFGFEQNRWGYQKSITAVILVVAGGTMINRLLSNSAIAELFQGYSRDSAVAFQGQNILLLIAATVILGPITEEMIFRGMIFRRAAFYLGSVPAYLISAVLFGAYHGNMLQFLYGIIIGIVLSWMYDKSGSLKLSIVTHMLLNLIALLFSSFL